MTYINKEKEEESSNVVTHVTAVGCDAYVEYDLIDQRYYQYLYPVYACWMQMCALERE